MTRLTSTMCVPPFGHGVGRRHPSLTLPCAQREHAAPLSLPRTRRPIRRHRGGKICYKKIRSPFPSPPPIDGARVLRPRRSRQTHQPTPILHPTVKKTDQGPVKFDPQDKAVHDDWPRVAAEKKIPAATPTPLLRTATPKMENPRPHRPPA